ncbi:hypothetical protein KP509_24G048800 [Ceratopteris richardii]|uniref:BCNT-C domain-containing protein n=1 Tax=Ceratopteris richardii TaxID=49495 RepID=A0A8T2RXN9_CERRI|nr:hypothetical protein KP509_24G048800 [Ceratopteris richardii]
MVRCFVALDDKSRIDEIWRQLNTRKPIPVPASAPAILEEKIQTKGEKKISTPDWMVSLGFARQKSLTSEVKVVKETKQIEDKEALKRIAAAALAAAKDAAISTKEGKLMVSEVRDFAGEEVKVTKLIDPNSKAAEELKRRQSSAGVDRVLQQFEKKQKLNVLDKSRKDWTDFKEEKQIEEELESYKKSGDKYTERVAFLQRTGHREYERERDVRLAQQAKRQSDISYTEEE